MTRGETGAHARLIPTKQQRGRPVRREKIVRRRLASGEIKEYSYPKDGKKGGPKTMGNLMAEYRNAPEFRSLSPGSRKVYQRAMDKIGDAYDSVPVADVRRGSVYRMRDDWQHKPALANQILKLWSILMKFAVDREYITASPAHGVGHLGIGEHKRWPDAVIDYALETLPEQLRRAVVLALYTGQRAGDCIAMRWSAYDGAAINVVQQKTGARLWIPCPAELRAELDAWKQGPVAVTILTNSKGNSWRPAGFFGVMSRALGKDATLNGYVFHGLRRSAASRLAEAGCTVNQIGAITGHKSLQMLQHYTKETEQRTLAKSAIILLDNHRKRRP